jgi:hypothetical protein
VSGSNEGIAVSGAWIERLAVDPIPGLLSSGDRALRYFVRCDLTGEDAGPVAALWELPAVEKLVRKQQDGSWRYPGRNRAVYTETNYDLLQTFKALGQLVGKYGLDRSHPAIPKAADYVFSCQTDEGDTGQVQRP